GGGCDGIDGHRGDRLDDDDADDDEVPERKRAPEAWFRNHRGCFGAQRHLLCQGAWLVRSASYQDFPGTVHPGSCSSAPRESLPALIKSFQNRLSCIVGSGAIPRLSYPATRLPLFVRTGPDRVSLSFTAIESAQRLCS